MSANSLLSQTSRASFQTLLDARTLTAVDDSASAIIYLASDQPPVHLSRRQFRQQLRTYAAGWQQQSLQPGALVLIAHTQSLASIFAFWGAMAAGLRPAMFPTLTEKLDTAVYNQQLRHLVQTSHLQAILTTADFKPFMQTAVACPVLDDAQLAQADPTEVAFTPAQPDQIAFVQHSSGTTGLQKGVALTHTAVLNQLASYSDAIGLTPQDVVVSWLPLYHDMGLIAGFLLPLVQGIPLVLMSPFDWVRQPAMLLQAIDRYQGSLCWLPNFAYNHCARRIRSKDKAGLSLASMRLFVNCSEPVRQDSHQLFLDAFAANGVQASMLGVSYAMAENSFAVTQTAPDQPIRQDVIDGQLLATAVVAQVVPVDHPQATIKLSCGRPISQTAVAIWDAHNQPLPDRQVGEIVIQSNCMLDGYYRRPDLRPFVDGWFKTGDRGYLAEGELFVIGRTKDLIINAGKNIYPQDIEAIVNQIEGVHAGRAVCFGVPDAKEGTELLAVVAEVESEETAVRQAINRAIRQEVARQTAVTLSYVYLVGPHWLLKTSSGKIAREANRQKWAAESGQVAGDWQK